MERGSFSLGPEIRGTRDLGAFGWDQNLNSGPHVRKYESNNNNYAWECKIVQFRPGEDGQITTSARKHPPEECWTRREAPETMLKQNAEKRFLSALSQRQSVHNEFMGHIVSMFHETDALCIQETAMSIVTRQMLCLCVV